MDIVMPQLKHAHHVQPIVATVLQPQYVGMEHVILEKIVEHVQPIVATVRQPHFVAMEPVILGKIAEHVQAIALVHVHVLMEKYEMIQMYA
jgi:hypothetical protein